MLTRTFGFRVFVMIGIGITACLLSPATLQAVAVSGDTAIGEVRMSTSPELPLIGYHLGDWRSYPWAEAYAQTDNDFDFNYGISGAGAYADGDNGTASAGAGIDSGYNAPCASAHAHVDDGQCGSAWAKGLMFGYADFSEIQQPIPFTVTVDTMSQLQGASSEVMLAVGLWEGGPFILDGMPSNQLLWEQDGWVLCHQYVGYSGGDLYIDYLAKSFSYSEAGEWVDDTEWNLALPVSSVDGYVVMSYAFADPNGQASPGLPISIPEPSTLILLGMGAVTLLLYRRKRNA